MGASLDDQKARRAAYRNAQDPNAAPGWSRQRSADLRRRFNMTTWEWEEMFDRQSRLCYLCRSAHPGHGWTVDHDHGCCPGRSSCGQCIAGIACTPCNLLEAHMARAIERGGLEAITRLLDRAQVARPPLHVVD